MVGNPLSWGSGAWVLVLALTGQSPWTRKLTSVSQFPFCKIAGIGPKLYRLLLALSSLSQGSTVLGAGRITEKRMRPSGLTTGAASLSSAFVYLSPMV